MPQAINTWAAALEGVNRYGLPESHPSFTKSDLGYIFPEPAMIAATQDSSKQRAMLRTWLKFRPALIYRVTRDTPDLAPLAGQAWKLLLLMDVLNPVGAKNKERAEAMKRFLKGCLDGAEGVALKETVDTEGEPSWRGRAFSNLGTPTYAEKNPVL